MSRCSICNKSSNETTIFEGVSQDEIIRICESCAELENIPLIKKPSSSQLNAAERPQSVKERMERLSGLSRSPLSRDYEVAQRNIHKLRPAPIKQASDMLKPNYDWLLKMARRRMKLTLTQLSEKTGVPVKVIEDFERAQLPLNLYETAIKLENALDIQLVISHEKEISFTRSIDREKEILAEVEEKMNLPKAQQREIEKMNNPNEEFEETNQKSSISQTHTAHPTNQAHTIHDKKREEARQEKMNLLKKGKLDLSRRQNLDNLKLSDLVELKKKREQDALMGDDLDFEDE